MKTILRSDLLPSAEADHDRFVYQIRDAAGRVLLHSANADPVLRDRLDQGAAVLQDLGDDPSTPGLDEGDHTLA